MSNRTELAQTLRDNLPWGEFDVKDVEDLPDTIRKTTVIIRHRDYQPAPNARGTMFATFLITVVSHHADRRKAEDLLETAVPEVLEAIDHHAGLTWSNATRVLVKDTYLGYDITASIPTPTPY